VIPGKLLIFVVIDDSSFKTPFKLRDGIVEEPGSYALIYSFSSNITEMAHLDSKLVSFGTLDIDSLTSIPKIYPIPVSSIVGPCIAVPYKIDDEPKNATEWLVMQSRENWNQTFIDFMETIK
jgi:hypothetical protein